MNNVIILKLSYTKSTKQYFERLTAVASKVRVLHLRIDTSYRILISFKPIKEYPDCMSYA